MDDVGDREIAAGEKDATKVEEANDVAPAPSSPPPPPPRGPPPPLKPPKWTEYETPEGIPYWFNEATKESVWEKPKALEEAPAPPPRPPPGKPPKSSQAKKETEKLKERVVGL